jgi:DNA uptake protein ComE-like DNA-binding protein
MKLHETKLNFAGRAKKSASVLIIVLWIVIGLVGVTLYFANSMTLELRASDNRADGLAADQAIEGAARYVGYELENFATNGTMPTNAQFISANVPIGDSHFWIIGRDNSGAAASTDPTFGLIDEASKLNLNRANTNMLSYLPNMTIDLANAIVDWRGSNGMAGYSLNYSTLGYDDKNSPFETVDELRLVFGATVDLLAGDDINRNGVLDANEKSATGGTTPNFGLFEYTTVYSREPNFHSDGTSLTNVNTATQNSFNALFQAAAVNNADMVATAVYRSIHPQGNPAPPAKPCAGILDFCGRCLQANMSADDFAKIYNNVTTTTNLYTYGRVNINTADEAVLTALFMGSTNIDQDTATAAAQALVAYRQQNPSSLNSIAWIASALGSNYPSILTALAAHDWTTTKSFQFTADIAAVGPFGRGYRRVKFIFDITDGTPKILYRQDLSRLGWALGEKARETLVANNTQ